MDQFNRTSLFEFPRLFASLESLDRGSLCGMYRGSFAGPDWLRRLIIPLLAVLGMRDWWGKEFDLQGNAINLVYKHGRLVRCFPMLQVDRLSIFDGKPTLALRYAPDNPFPYPLIVDELRRAGPGLLLGMTMVTIGPFQRLALPFVLLVEEKE